MSVGGLIAGTEVEVVGVEDEPSGGTRVYLTHRSRGIYAVIQDEEAERKVRAAWASNGRLTIPTPPPGCVYSDER